MLISKAGNYKGFSLIELIVVLVILGVVATIAFPKLEGVFPSSCLRSSARRLAGMIRWTESQAAVSGKEHRLYYDLDRGEYWMAEKEEEEFLESSDNLGGRRKLLPGIRFQKVITLEEGTVSEGIASSWFSSAGLVEETTIHLINEKEKELSILIKGLIGKVKIYEGDEE